MSQQSLFDRPAAPRQITPLAVGHRVRVTIRDRDRYAFGCAEILDGRTGTLDRFMEHSFNGDNSNGPAWLVHFDDPVPSWSSHNVPFYAFWFPPGDLETL